jgi:hypothetical protein
LPVPPSGNHARTAQQRLVLQACAPTHHNETGHHAGAPGISRQVSPFAAALILTACRAGLPQRHIAGDLRAPHPPGHIIPGSGQGCGLWVLELSPAQAGRRAVSGPLRCRRLPVHGGRNPLQTVPTRMFQPVAQTLAKAPVTEDLGLLSGKCPRYRGRVGSHAVCATGWFIHGCPVTATHGSAVATRGRTMRVNLRIGGPMMSVASFRVRAHAQPGPNAT